MLGSQWSIWRPDLQEFIMIPGLLVEPAVYYPSDMHVMLTKPLSHTITKRRGLQYLRYVRTRTWSFTSLLLSNQTMRPLPNSLSVFA